MLSKLLLESIIFIKISGDCVFQKNHLSKEGREDISSSNIPIVHLNYKEKEIDAVMRLSETMRL